LHSPGEGAVTRSLRTKSRYETGFVAAVDRLSDRALHDAPASHDLNVALEAVNRICESDTLSEYELHYGLPMKELLGLCP
jgi:hypothetical protein